MFHRARLLPRAHFLHVRMASGFCEGEEKAPAVENFAWLPMGVKSNKPARGSVSLI